MALVEIAGRGSGNPGGAQYGSFAASDHWQRHVAAEILVFAFVLGCRSPHGRVVEGAFWKAATPERRVKVADHGAQFVQVMEDAGSEAVLAAALAGPYPAA